MADTILKVVCKSCEEIVVPRSVYDEMGRVQNNECPDCGAFIGKIVDNPNFHYIGQEGDENPVYLHHELPEGEEMDISAIPQPGDVENFL